MSKCLLSNYSQNSGEWIISIKILIMQEYAPLYSFIYDNDFEKARSIWSNRSENSAEDLMFIQI
ncbi:hypothetical protein COS66_03540 [Candidatus Berkelbacteria bacterium CG06_land_8_20_14_3_00_43_10]|uniref:Uncharacterized protein n=1 Tax=Candidatus Berkelbacteria bacterium CG10_big_fil_rev_8_21_14_0_10_43_14 TaxID=1974515 RepID=A0A2M6R8M0_9BACT|nr:MAG: hypothetical protein AUK41_01850 [Candidatus Berkelbacteria bacterium CG2_30_43_20]PIS06856.1 MAG: hypothetical protein COT79_02495 [Candidatus Berkelbacteria bacterium CG10_big_fil_rev_8_21_14_0_10_43_14]PIU86923.1 MAG: hypothetical protein COS66_03540 [Candidatus Berkelbacteria bacterium CG06_land_8_20_14_3_00_43_10]